jgi:hypothetical protein
MVYIYALTNMLARDKFVLANMLFVVGQVFLANGVECCGTSKMRGFFAALRMTIVYLLYGNREHAVITLVLRSSQ